MKDCRRVRKNLAAWIGRELSENEEMGVKLHLETCRACAEELAGLRKVAAAADSFQKNLEGAMASVDWEKLPGQIADRVFQKEIVPGRESVLRRLGFRLTSPRLRPVYAALAMGIVLGSLATLLLFKPGAYRGPESEGYFASGDSLERVELEMARRNTLDYLERSQYLLLDFIQASPEQGGPMPGAVASGQARGLLEKKRYLNRELDKFQMAKAKEICDQIELLFFELSQIDGGLPEAELVRLQKMVREKQLLLKIKLVKKELEESEV